MRKCVISKLILASFLSLLAYKAEAFSCYGIIKNSSSGTWKVLFAPNTTEHVWFVGSVCNGQADTCILHPNENAYTQYTTEGGVISGQVHITDSTGATQAFNYQNPLLNECPHIGHDGDTGAVVLNNPRLRDHVHGNGNITIEEDTWKSGGGVPNFYGTDS